MAKPENTTSKYLLDTNVFNWLVKGDLSIFDLPSDGDLIATPVQRAELEATPGDEKRKILLATFSEVVTGLFSTSFAFDVPGAGFGQGRWTCGKLVDLIQSDLDRDRKKPNNLQDALIAETAITNGFTLVTCDGPLKQVAETRGCHVLFFEKRICATPPPKP
jgi:predicted nucleic acid-binding protein